MTGVEAALQEAAGALHKAAREHKRASSAHRRQARETMEALERLRKVAAEHGVELTTTKTQGEGDTHGQ